MKDTFSRLLTEYGTQEAWNIVWLEFTEICFHAWRFTRMGSNHGNDLSSKNWHVVCQDMAFLFFGRIAVRRGFGGAPIYLHVHPVIAGLNARYSLPQRDLWMLFKSVASRVLQS
jgi:hypothetical protein